MSRSQKIATPHLRPLRSIRALARAHPSRACLALLTASQLQGELRYQSNRFDKVATLAEVMSATERRNVARDREQL